MELALLLILLPQTDTIRTVTALNSTMITKYFTKVVVRFNPLGKEGKPARLFLSSIPPSMRGACIIDSKLITDNTTPVVKVTFKDKKTLEIDPSGMTFNELSQVFDRHSRGLQIKESIEA